MAALPYMQLYIADYLADTMHLSTEEHGAYLLLMFNYWQTGRPIPKSRLAKIARLSNDRWIAVEGSLKEFFNDNGIEWSQERIERDLESVKTSLSQKSAAGKASAQARKAKKASSAQRQVNDRSTGVGYPFEQESNGNPTNKDTDTDTDLKDKQERENNAGEEFSTFSVNLSSENTFLPPFGKFPITNDWTPSPEFVRQAGLWGKNVGAEPGYTPEELQQFRDYWSCDGRVKHHQQWEMAFADSLLSTRARGSRLQQPKRGTGFAVSKPDEKIPEGFRGAP